MTGLVKRMAVPVVLATLLAPLAARADRNKGKHSPFNNINVGGTSPDGNVFSGTMDVLGFVNDEGVPKAIAAISGTIREPGGATQQVANVIALVPIDVPAMAKGIGGAAPTLAQATGSCSILHLDLGPLDLNLLGLTVHLNEVILDIAAQPGPGNLLGNLLCAITNLLNGIDLGNILSTALTNVLTNLLNNLLGAL